MKKYLALISATVLGFFVLGLSTTMGQGYGKTTTSSAAQPGGSPSASPGANKPGSVGPSGIITATPITKEEAMKKYPPPRGGYPTGDRPTSHVPGHILSPYAPHKEFDCSSIPHGGLVLDTFTNHVFVRP